MTSKTTSRKNISFPPFRLICMVGWIILVLSSCSGTEKGAEANTLDSLNNSIGVDTAENALSELPPEEQIAKVTEQMKFSPDNFQLYHDRSLLFYETGNTVQAVQDMERSKELNPREPSTHHMLGFYAYVQNDEQQAMRHLKNARQMGSDNPETFYMMGQIRFMQKEYHDAEEYYKAAMKLDSLTPVYPFAVGFMAQSRGDLTKAIDWYKKSLEVYPGFIKALAQLHDIYRNERNDYPTAAAYNDRILMVDSLHPVGRFNQGLLFMERASRITSNERAPEYDVLMKLAISEFGKAIMSDEDFVNAYYNRGYCYFMLSQFTPALKDFTTVIEKEPFYYQAFFYQGAIYEQYRDTVSAVNAYQQALKINPSLRDADIAIKELTLK